ncbi:predicted protein [Verticillium alfalfae VaMs.102]|uniref:Predicted protein n=1 Tax=Verticillium alfalfae (strain VaMs.102 / ATCC MYA-4576 / FGSC 10136) TaxID=526221 RepID=C9S9M2_VERA1|nr:predicted protein [Verticillium alfalfae VaMs.102]EEY16085.1 predicted protein [Verticillium alfalfae VaMs.102]
MSRNQYPQPSVFALDIFGLKSSRLLVLALMRNRQQLSPTDLQGWKDVAARRWAMTAKTAGNLIFVGLVPGCGRRAICRRHQWEVQSRPDYQPPIHLCFNKPRAKHRHDPFLPANVPIRTRLLNAYHAGPRFARYGAMPPAIVCETGQVEGPVCVCCD